MINLAIPLRKLGRTGLLVSELSLGGVGIGGRRTTQADDALGVATFQYALERGMNYVDTSPLYGESERRVGLAFQQTGGCPKGLYISTKCGTHPRYRGDCSAKATRWMVENRLKVMGVDSIDVVLIQTPPAYLEALDPVLKKRRHARRAGKDARRREVSRDRPGDSRARPDSHGDADRTD